MVNDNKYLILNTHSKEEISFDGQLHIIFGNEDVKITGENLFFIIWIL